MKTLTTPADAMQIKNTRIWNEEYQEHEYVSTYSKRGGCLEEADLGSVMLKDVFKEIRNRDDWGIVTLYSCKNGDALKAYIEMTNLGYSVRSFINNTPLPSQFFDGSIVVADIF